MQKQTFKTMNESDAETLKRLLGAKTIPANIEASYWMAKRAFDRINGGASKMAVHMLQRVIQDAGNLPESADEIVPDAPAELGPWASVAQGTPVIATIGGKEIEGEFVAVLSGDRVSVDMKDKSKPRSLPQSAVRVAELATA